MFGFLKKIIGAHNDRELKKYRKIVHTINGMEQSVARLSDAEIQGKTAIFKSRLAAGATLDSILPEAFATVREASKRVLGMRHFDTQLIGGMVLHDGKIAEMKTGEGKTLVATLPVYLNALTGKGVHVVTVNDYLASRDAQIMGQLYNFLQLSVGVSVSGMSESQKKQAYAADITYGTNHEFGFDYLRDNTKYSPDDIVLRSFNYAIVDEVDSILIDEARTPLIISGEADSDSMHLYTLADEAIKSLNDDDYVKDEKHRNIHLTDSGNEKVEMFMQERGLLSSPQLYDTSNMNIVYHLNCALRANKMFRKDVDYMVHNGNVLIIDEYTGRVLQGRRYSEGLHQAIEAKEGVEIQLESQTIASITYQNLFRMYPKLSGMTGTAITEEAEFDEIYKLGVVSIPTNKPVIRLDKPDRVFTDQDTKDKAIVELIKERRAQNQPILVGTCSLEKSEKMSQLLKLVGIPHNVLNAKQHEKEAYVIAEAGTPGCVTIATNMAGRGTDIKLGGNVEMRIQLECSSIDDENERERMIHKIREDVEHKKRIVLDAGGLLVIGTERNESRRIDNQLCGRSGRQGDPGESIFFFSFQDEITKYYSLKFPIGTPGEIPAGKFISKRISYMQNKICAMNFDIRKQVIKYDDVVNTQRQQIYQQRNMILYSDNVESFVFEMLDDVINDLVEANLNSDSDLIIDDTAKKNSYEPIIDGIRRVIGITVSADALINASRQSTDEVKRFIFAEAKDKYSNLVNGMDAEVINRSLKYAALSSIDNCWKDHLAMLDFLRKNVNYSSYAQKSPINVYQSEAFNLFNDMLSKIRNGTLISIFVRENLLRDDAGLSHNNNENDTYDSDYLHQLESLEKQLEEYLGKLKSHDPSAAVSRNSLCKCGSGKKTKHCCGKISTNGGVTNIAADALNTLGLSKQNISAIEGDFDDEEHYKGYDDSGLIESFNEKNIKLVDDNKDASESSGISYDTYIHNGDDDISIAIDIDDIGPDNINDYIGPKKNEDEH